MKEEVAKEWVAELRSGRWKQAISDLQNKGGHCCLGVLCEIAERHGVKVHRDVRTKLLCGIYLNHQPEVQAWAGINTPSGHLGNGTIHTLASLNDNGRGFYTIAAKIEEHWKTI